MSKVYLGIDWSESKHDAVFLNAAGVEQARLTFAHSPAGFQALDQLRQRLGLAPHDCVVGLETAHNILIDDLWARGYCHVFVIPPSVTVANRGRVSSSGAHDDHRDAHVLADTLRTDQARLHPWHPDSLLVRQLRAEVSQHLCLTHQIVRLFNRLRSLLLRYYPAALHVFKDPLRPLALHWLCAYPTPQAAAHVSAGEFAAFARQHGYPRRASELAACYQRLQDEQPQAAPETVLVYQTLAVQLAELLLPLLAAKQASLRRAQQLFQQHPDAPIFASLPGVGEFLAPALLAKFGEDRQRFPTAAGLQALAGTCPVTQASGKLRFVRKRQACDREFRYIAQQWARCSLRSSPYAQAYMARVRTHSESENHALRCLANRWLAIAWKLWQTRQPYDEGYHLRQRAERSQPYRPPSQLTA